MARAGRVAKPDGTIAPAPRVRKAVVDCFARRSIGSGTRAVTIAECTATRRETGIPAGEHAADAGTTGPRADRRGARRSRLDRPGPRRDEPRRGARDRGARVQNGARPRIRRLHAVRRWAGGRGARSETGRIYPVQRRVAGGQVCGRAAGRVASARRSAPVPVRQHRRRHAVHQRPRSRSEEPPHLAPPARSPAGDAGRLARSRDARRLGQAPPSGSGRGLHGGAPDASLVAARPYPDVAGTGAGLPLSGYRWRRSGTSNGHSSATARVHWSRWRPAPARRSSPSRRSTGSSATPARAGCSSSSIGATSASRRRRSSRASARRTITGSSPSCTLSSA